MSLPPLPEASPYEVGIVRKVAGIVRQPQPDRTESSLVLIVAPVRPWLHSERGTGRLWRNDAVDLRSQVAVRVPLTYLPAAPVGTLYIGHDLVAPTVDPTPGVHTGEFGVVVPDEPVYVQLDALVPDREKKEYVLNPHTHSFGSAYHGVRNTYYVQLSVGRGRTLLIPVEEVIRFYWGTSSSPFFERLLASRATSLLEREHLHEFLDLNHTGMDDEGIFHAALRPGLSYSDARVLGRLWNDPLARLRVTQMLSGFRLPQPGFLAKATRTSFPFAGETRLKVEGVYTHQDGGWTMLVHRIRRCTHPFPFEEVRVVAPKYSQFLSPDAVSEDRPEGQPPQIAGSRSRKRPSVTGWAPPRRIQPVMYRQERYEDMFPDTANKPVRTIRANEVVGARGRKRKDQDPRGGFGPGVPGGEGVPVAVQPEAEVVPDPPEKARRIRSPRPYVGHLDTLDRAVPLLKQKGYEVMSCCVTEPESGCFSFRTDEEVREIPADSDLWEHVYDPVLGMMRLRRGRIIRIGKRQPAPEGKEGAMAYGYAFEVELEGSAFVYFEHVTREMLQEDVLQEAIRVGLARQGVWRSAAYREIDGKTKKYYQSNLILPDVSVCSLGVKSGKAIGEGPSSAAFRV
ncbi:hypothetical protein, partial [Deinococcus budaensis]